MARESAVPGARMPGRAPPAKSGGQKMPTKASAPASEPAFKATPGRSSNKTVVAGEPAFRTKGGKWNNS